MYQGLTFRVYAEKNPQKNVWKVLKITNFGSSPQFSHLKNRGRNN